ncbi:MAG: asparaginase domain-containing protein [Patescibacteria group bacterium]
MKNNQNIEFIITGGTIDSYYEGIKDAIVPLKKSVLPSFIKSLKIEGGGVISFVDICMKDSRSLTSEDLKKILKAIEKSKSKKIIITHGTYTMPDTARFLTSQLKRKDKVIILTGAMIPLTGFSPSDAPFNLGYALASVKTLKPGVYVCMNGQIFGSSEVAKRISEGKFVSVFNKN